MSDDDLPESRSGKVEERHRQRDLSSPKAEASA